MMTQKEYRVPFGRSFGVLYGVDILLYGLLYVFLCENKKIRVTH